MKQPLIPPSERWIWLFLFAMAWMAGMHLSLWDQDESAYAGFAFQMIESGNWLIPDFLWSEVHRKPPLHFWAIALSNLLFGFHEFAIRIPSLLAIFGTVLLVRYQAVQVFGEQVAKTAAWILAGNILLLQLIKISVTDSSLLFFETLAALSLINFLHQAKARYWWLLLLGTTGALLVKGPPVLILLFGMLGLFLVFSHERRKIIGLHPWLLFPLAALPLFLWGWFAWQSDGGIFILWMVDWYTIRRVSSEVFGQTGPPGYHFVLILLAFLPFIPLFFKSAKSLIQQYSWKKPEYSNFILLAWLISGWVIYELFKSKLPTYAIAAYPAIAILVARQFVKLQAGAFLNELSLKAGLIVFAAISFGVGIGIPLAMEIDYDGAALFSDNIIMLGRLLGIILFSISGAIIVMLLKSRFAIAFKLMLSYSLCLLFGLWFVFVPAIETPRSGTKALATWLAENIPPEKTVLLSKNMTLPSLAFYLKQQNQAFEIAKSPDVWAKAIEEEQTYLVFNSDNIALLQETVTSAKLHFDIVYEKEAIILDFGKRTTWFVVKGSTPK
ncbi:MAG: ArnT family glycosyltransferase [Bacteroidia bacterium]